MSRSTLTDQQKEQNQELYNQLTSNIYFVDEDPVRASSILEALEKAKGFNPNPKVVEKYVPQEELNFPSDIFTIIGQLNVLERHIDEESFYREIIHGENPNFTINTVHESYLQELQAVTSIKENVSNLEEALTKRCQMIELIIEERKEKKEAA